MAVAQRYYDASWMIPDEEVELLYERRRPGFNERQEEKRRAAAMQLTYAKKQEKETVTLFR